MSTLIIGLSGPSSSGKTTLARLLRQIWPGSFIIHEDDFYWSDKQIPVRNGVQDWDCLESIDLSKLRSCLQYVKQHSCPPPGLTSQEDQNSVGKVDMDEAAVAAWSTKARGVMSKGSPRSIVIVDGFLLYSREMGEVSDLFDVKLFLRSDFETTKTRREARSGYVTIEGFWKDPPGYVDNIVWPNYVKDHSYLFEKGDVEGDFDLRSCRDAGIAPVPRDAEHDMTACVQWACDIIEKCLASGS